jgi:hypothetical protein
MSFFKIYILFDKNLKVTHLNLNQLLCLAAFQHVHRLVGRLLIFQYLMFSPTVVGLFSSLLVSLFFFFVDDKIRC